MTRSFLGPTWWIALEEWRAMQRNHVALAAIGTMLLLALAATLVGLEHKRATDSDRSQYQAVADEQWHAQPDRHPHRVVHYGHYVFRPLGALAFFDFGVDPFTGQTIYLEGHRQNTANFSDAGQSSVLLRFGLLTPAFVLQTLVPLLIIFLAFGSIARERENGQWRMILAQGVGPIQILSGKLASHAVVALILASPALVALAVIALLVETERIQAVFMILGYGIYLLSWVGLAVLVSAAVPKARDALIALVGLWIISVILLPRMLPDIASTLIPLPTRIEVDVAVHKDLAAIGDSHNPDDPYFEAFRAKTLAAYGVKRVENLPVNYAGLLMQEGERLTSELFARAMQAEFDLQESQSGVVDNFSLLSPVIALRQMSMALAGTDRERHQQFLLEAETYRYALIQALNRLHTEQVKYQNDRDQRISHMHWQDLPRFAFPPPDISLVLKRRVLPALVVLGSWFVLIGLAMLMLARRLEKAGR
jgi:ABC-2 type transport system permease protein